MIKVLLKHWIYETCINIIFDIIKRNFSAPHIELYNNYYALPLINRVFPDLFANKAVSTQPMVMSKAEKHMKEQAKLLFERFNHNTWESVNIHGWE